MGVFLRAGQLALGAAVVGAAFSSCYSAGAGTSPPPNSFYFPVALAVSPDGKVLYAANSDFDLQWNGGTLQTYDLTALRTDAAGLITANLANTAPPASIPFLSPLPTTPGVPLNCVGMPTPGVPLGQSCAPPVDSDFAQPANGPMPPTIDTYLQSAVIIGAFATDAQLSIAGGAAECSPTAVRAGGRRRRR